MPELSEGARRKARYEVRKWRYVRDYAAIAALGVPAAAAMLLLAPAAILAAPIVFGGINILGTRKADSAGDKANDPPREDFRLETVVVEPRLPEFFGDSPLERATAELFRSVDATVAVEQAMVTADERALGAQLSGEQVFEAARREEAIRFGTASAEMNLGLQHHTDRVVALLMELAPDWKPCVDVATALRGAGAASAQYGRQYLSGGRDLFA